MGKFVDLSGQRFGRLEVLNRVENLGRRVRYLCKCDCGNKTIVHADSLKSGNTQSCGCYHKDRTRESCSKEIIGKQFGWLTVDDIISGDKKHNRRVICRCVCGNQIDVKYGNLISGQVKSCGCLRKQISAKNAYDIDGKIINDIVIIGRAGSRRREALWGCKCFCGRYFQATSHQLLKGLIKSCGCIKSYPEEIIAQFLDNHNIEYVRQKRFDDCRDKHILSFDFYIESTNSAIEYDGELHYIQNEGYNDLDKQQKHDAIKTQYCERHNINLLRIPYWERDNIESILSEWLQIDNSEEANSSAVDLSA